MSGHHIEKLWGIWCCSSWYLKSVWRCDIGLCHHATLDVPPSLITIISGFLSDQSLTPFCISLKAGLHDAFRPWPEPSTEEKKNTEDSDNRLVQVFQMLGVELVYRYPGHDRRYPEERGRLLWFQMSVRSHLMAGVITHNHLNLIHAREWYKPAGERWIFTWYGRLYKYEKVAVN